MLRAWRAAVAVAVIACAIAVPFGAAGARPDVFVRGPGDLLGGLAVRPKLGGTYYQQGRVINGQLRVDLTLQLPAVPNTGTPGPVVVLWQGMVGAAQRDHGDIVERAVGDPRSVVIAPTCDTTGNCALRFSLRRPIAPALRAAELPELDNVGMGFLVAAVRTFDGSSRVQVVQPGVSGTTARATLSEPLDTYGALSLSPLVDVASAEPVPLVGDAFGQATDDELEWGRAVQDALAAGEVVPTDDVRIAVWTPTEDDVRHVMVDLEFSDTCPEDRFVVIRNDATGEVALALHVGGATAARSDVALPSGGLWTVGVHAANGDTLNAVQLSQGTSDIRVTGPVRCTNGKGVINEEGLAPEIPNPSDYEASSPTPHAADAGGQDGRSTPGSFSAPANTMIATFIAFGLLVGGLGFIGVRRAQARSSRVATPRS